MTQMSETPDARTTQDGRILDAVVVGGGAAGLSAGIVLARSRRDVVVIDAGQPRNAPAAGVHALLGHDGIPPCELLARGRAELAAYGGTVVDGRVERAHRDGANFVVSLAGGRALRARRLVIATGLSDELPPIPGLRERWGRDVVHCPYCHGWEVRDRAIGVLATGLMSVHHALLFRQLSADIVFFAQDERIEPADRERLEALGIKVLDGAVSAIDIREDALTGVRMADGRVVPRDVVAAASRMVANVEAVADLGLEIAASPMGTAVVADPMGRTPVPGVWVAGNVGNLSAQVGAAAAEGTLAGAQVNADLIAEDADSAVARRRAA